MLDINFNNTGLVILVYSPHNMQYNNYTVMARSPGPRLQHWDAWREASVGINMSKDVGPYYTF
jgi:hypothetical protein